MSREVPMLFNEAMVKAILAGQKVVTRRPASAVDVEAGDLLWVRETHWIGPLSHNSEGQPCPPWGGLPYTVSPDGAQCAFFRAGFDRTQPRPWRPSIHMPRWASRLTLRVISRQLGDVRNVDDNEAFAEGFRDRAEFLAAWRSIYSSGPQVCDAIRFEVLTTGGAS